MSLKVEFYWPTEQFSWKSLLKCYILKCPMTQILWDWGTGWITKVSHEEQVLMCEWQMDKLYLFPLVTQTDLSPTQHWTLQGRVLLGQPGNDHSDSATCMHLKLIHASDMGQMENEICKQT